MANEEEAIREQARRHRPGRAFPPGTIVLVSLDNPREKFWGAILELAPVGLSMRGVDLSSFEDFVSLFRAGESVRGSEVFFPMHRVARIEADLRSAGVPSLSERFLAATGQSAAALLEMPEAGVTDFDVPDKDQSRSVPDR